MNDSEGISYDDMLDDVKTLAYRLDLLHRRCIAEIAPQVRELMDSGSRDDVLIEQKLDLLLDSACIPEGLSLFKVLCRYYWDINPDVAASYVDGYRWMWDAESFPEDR